MQTLAVRHLDPKTGRPFGDTFLTLSPACDHGSGLRFLLAGLSGWSLAVGVFDPEVNAAGDLAAQHREQGIEPADASYPPAMAAALFCSAAKRREQIAGQMRAQLDEQGVEDVDVLVR